MVNSRRRGAARAPGFLEFFGCFRTRRDCSGSFCRDRPPAGSGGGTRWVRAGRRVASRVGPGESGSVRLGHRVGYPGQWRRLGSRRLGYAAAPRRRRARARAQAGSKPGARPPMTRTPGLGLCVTRTAGRGQDRIVGRRDSDGSPRALPRQGPAGPAARGIRVTRMLALGDRDLAQVSDDSDVSEPGPRRACNRAPWPGPCGPGSRAARE